MLPRSTRTLSRLVRHKPFSLSYHSRNIHVETEEMTTPQVDQMAVPNDGWSNRLQSAALREVPQYGWTKEAIIEAARREKASLSCATITDPARLVEFWMHVCHTTLERDLKAARKAENDKERTTLQWLEFALKTRLSYNQMFIIANQWHSAMVIGARPEQAATTRQQLEDLVSLAVLYSNSKFTELEKIGIGMVYVSTELHMLTDESDGFRDSWDFLQQRLKEWDSLRTGGPALPDTQTAFAMGSALSSGVASILGIGGNSLKKNNSSLRHPAELLWEGVASVGDMSNPKTKAGSDPRFFDPPESSKTP